jgi:regulator of sigma E protease
MKPGPTPGKQFGEVFQMLGDTWYALTHAKQTGVSARSFSGPVGIAGGWWMEISSGGITRGIKFAILINIALAVFNLLPLPVLDGGHIVFAGIEGAMKRPLNAKFVNAVQTAFAVLLIGFMLYVTAFDFQKFFGHKFSSSRKTQTAPATNQVPANP